ncbi:hypothetical protein BH10ACI1_BH10ACI1_19650 [soil metagenome]
MSIIESSATALVRFTGMGIMRFCQNVQRGEIAAVRDAKHTLTVRIQQPVYRNGLERDVIVYEDLYVYEKLPDTGVEIEISTSGSSNFNGFEVYRNEHFDRLSSVDVNDLNWIVNMENLHGANLVNQTSLGAFPTSNIFIANGFFYTHKLDTDLFFAKVEKDANGKEVSRGQFGRVAETIGVKLEAEAVVFKIAINDLEEIHTLPHNNGLPFRIEITNVDTTENSVYSDMPEYYKYFADTTGTNFEFEVSEEDSGSSRLGGGSVNDLSFCHPIEAPC